MIQEKIKVAVETNTNIKFITSIPVTITVREILPILLKSYQAVVSQNFDEEERKGLTHANRIKKITKNGFLIPLSEEVIHVLNDGDALFIVVDKHEKKEVENSSKKEKLEAKKEEKTKEKKKEETKLQEEKKPVAPVTQKKEAIESKKEVPKKEEGKNNQSKSNISGEKIEQLLAKIREKPTTQSSQPVQSPTVAKKTKFIVAPPSESEDSS